MLVTQWVVNEHRRRVMGTQTRLRGELIGRRVYCQAGPVQELEIGFALPSSAVRLRLWSVDVSPVRYPVRAIIWFRMRRKR